jgi:hypothetical protein
MKSLQVLFAILISTMVILTSGCATGKKKPTELQEDELANVKKVDFIDDYSDMQPGRSPWDGMYVWQNPNAFFQQYSKVMIESVEFWGKSGVSPQGIKDEKRVADKLHDSMVKSFARRYEVVKQPGFDVLKIRLALVDEEANPPVERYKTAGAAVGKPPSGEPRVGRYITTLVVLQDSQTGNVVRKAIDRRFAAGDAGEPETWADVDASIDYYADSISWRFCKLKFDQGCADLKPAKITYPAPSS